MKSFILVAVAFLCLHFTVPTCAQNKEVNFDSQYINYNDGRTTVEIAEAQELIYIIFAMTPIGRKHPVMVNHKTKYHAEVLEHFSSYNNHPVVAKFDSLLNQNLINYFLLAANAYGFNFNGDRLVPTKVYDFPAKGIGKFEVHVNPVTTYLEYLQDFAKKSSFRNFYAKHKIYYDSLKNEYIVYASINKQKQWLESHFDYRINSYRVLTSPLIGGMNATHTFEDNGFKEILLFLPTIRNDKEWDEVTRKTMNTRIIFTEIDHNYVGPVSAVNLEVINRSVSNRPAWIDSANKGTDHYPNPLKIFDEYLTWGIFLLYIHDTYPGDTDLLNNVTERVNEMMVATRGFVKAKEFNTQLLNLYRESDNKHIASLYPKLLNWCASQQ